MLKRIVAFGEARSTCRMADMFSVLYLAMHISVSELDITALFPAVDSAPRALQAWQVSSVYLNRS